MGLVEHSNELRLAEQAAHWLHVLETGGAEERAAFTEWLKESPRHVREFLVMSAWEKSFDQVDPERRFDIDALLAKSSANVVPLKSDVTSAAPPGGLRRLKEARSQGRWRWALVGAGPVAAATLLALTLWTLPPGSRGNTQYATAVGEQRTFELSDGSVVYLNTRSRMEVHFSESARDLTLVEGEALFKVQGNVKRPFRVHSGDAVIQAIGTQFNVRKDAQGTTVAVIEGRIAVSRNELSAGEEARIVAGKASVQRAPADLVKTTAWRQRRLVFRKDTLEEIAAEFNRYNRAPQIQVEGEALREKRFNGVFDADDPESLLKYLASDPSLAFEKRGDALIIRPSAQP